jgi:hypothetical protein
LPFPGPLAFNQAARGPRGVDIDFSDIDGRRVLRSQDGCLPA